MASPRQIAASRANGALSGGPKTQNGKIRAAGNRCRHGLYSKRIVLKTESQQAFDDLLARFTARLQPATTTEHEFVREIVSAQWRQARALQFQTEILNRHIPAGSEDPAHAAAKAWIRAVEEEPAFLQSIQAEGRYARQFDRALRDLVRAQSLRSENEHSNPPDAFLMSAEPDTTLPQTRVTPRIDDSNLPDEIFISPEMTEHPRSRHIHRFRVKQPDSS